jgi:hypothetical protein
MFMNERMRTMSLAGNSERRLRRWVENEGRGTDVAADVRILLARVDQLEPLLAVIPCPNPTEHEEVAAARERGDI